MLPPPKYIFNVQCTVVVYVWFPQMHKQDLFYCHSYVSFVMLRSGTVRQRAKIENFIARQNLEGRCCFASTFEIGTIWAL